MKKIILSLVLLTLSNNVSAVPVYTDEIPISHIKKVKSLQDKRPLVESLDSISKNQVKIYSDVTRKLSGKDIIVSSIKDTSKIIKLKNYKYKNEINLYDKVGFIASEDIYAKGNLFIKKGTIVTGSVTTATFPRSDQDLQPGELRINNFRTEDVDGNLVYLYGEVVSYSPNMGYFSSMVAFSPCIKKNRIYTLYFK